MEKKQYTITEYNDWEGESFGYIMDLTEDEINLVRQKAEKIFEDDGTITVEETNYSVEDVDKINKTSRNSYMNRLGFYKFQSESVLDEWDEHGDLFYKGVGLINIYE